MGDQGNRLSLRGYLPARPKVRFIGSLINRGVAMLPPISVPLLGHFAALSDPGQHARVLHPLSEILLLVLSATLARADDFVETTLSGTRIGPAVHADVEQLFNDPQAM
jgi:hypothetical protein